MGDIPGTLGEVCVIAILIGAILLLLFNVIDIVIPGMYLLTFSVCILLFANRGLDIPFLAAHLAGGGLMLGAWFMATDYVTRPITKCGQVIYGVLLGLLTALFRAFGNTADGVSFAILIGNICVPLIEKITYPRPLGRRIKKA